MTGIAPKLFKIALKSGNKPSRAGAGGAINCDTVDALMTDETIQRLLLEATAVAQCFVGVPRLLTTNNDETNLRRKFAKI